MLTSSEPVGATYQRVWPKSMRATAMRATVMRAAAVSDAGGPIGEDWRIEDLVRGSSVRIARGSQSWPVLGAGFKPVVRYFVSRVGSTPTGFRHKPFFSFNNLPGSGGVVPLFVPKSSLAG